MSFNQLTAFTKKVADFADQVTGNPADIKAQFDAAPEELRTYFNNLIDALKSTASGDSGAKNIGVTPITGLTGTDAQTILESINTTFANKTNQIVWTDVTSFSNEFSNWGDNVTYPKVGYSKDELNIIRLRGMVKTGSFGNNNAMLNLPAGYRPKYWQNFSCAAFQGSYGWGVADVEVNPSGNITTVGTLWNGNTGAAPLWVDLSNIQFTTA